jgi:hypothetical protein
MRRIVLNSFYLIGLTLACYLLSLLCLNRVEVSGKRLACWINPQFAVVGGQERQIFCDWSSEQDWDILVVGSSHAYRGYDPRIFESVGQKLYNFGSGYQNPIASYAILKDVAQLEAGTLVVIDLYDNTFVGDGVGCFSRLIANAPNHTFAQELLLNAPDIRVMNSYFGYLFTKPNNLESPLKKGYIKNGFSSSADSSMIQLDTLSQGMENLKFDKRYLHYLYSIIDLARSRGAHVVFASHPVPQTPVNSATHRQFLAFVASLLEDERVHYFDLSADLRFHPQHHFMDQNHLNQTGVELYNAMLLDSLMKYNLLNPKN